MSAVSIIIPHFNRPLLLKETLASVEQQSYRDWEVIVVDDQSDDDSYEMIQQYQSEKIKIYQRTEGIKGPSSSRNLGAAYATGKYLLFLDSDDLLKPFCLEQRVRMLETNPSCRIAIFLMELFEKKPGDSPSFFNIDAPHEALTGLFLRNENPWQTMAPLWEKDLFISSGGFDEGLLFMEDPELHLRVLQAPGTGLTTCYEMPADCYYRVNHIDETKKDFNYHSVHYRILFYKKILENYSADFIQINKTNIRAGILSILKKFLYSRKNQFPQLFKELHALMAGSNLFSPAEVSRIVFLVNWGNTDNWILKKLKLRGICYKLLPGK